ncbi:MAG TPA: bifunctional DNA-formamidopyrimidine glycosylase/DNA-(apurinic or apyrimidinic site) lyase [Anaerolineales bacterium]|nr:bifunctional DNA-formamidopyrimidine glycosylase/DNA-(apurinic or apyrimidinic site) lyase [Anaerolineales bacterium]
MPELPEVETIARQLRSGSPTLPPLPGRLIVAVTLRWPRHIAAPPADRFRQEVVGRTIREVGRRGKYLVFPLDRGTLLIHLKMSGDLAVVPSVEPSGPYDHTIFHLDQGWDLRFGDARKFGRVFLLDDPSLLLAPLGPEPLNGAFTPRSLARDLGRRGRSLKPLLLDQTFLAGVGNIYADEALHRAGLHPLRRADSLNDAEVRRLWRGLRAALRSGLRHNGASIDWVYRGGDFQNHFRVYQRAGLPCPVCGTAIRRITVGQRGTHYCPSCQPRRRRR